MKICNKISAVAVLMAAAFSISPAVAATENGDKFTLKYVAQYKGKTIQGMEISLAKVADIDGHVLAPYSSAVKDLEGVSGSSAIRYADEMAKIDNNDASKTVTDANGNASFSDLPEGIYLAKQTGSSGTASNYRAMNPALLSLPESAGDEDRVITSYVKTEPKEVSKDSNKPSDKGVTPDKEVTTEVKKKPARPDKTKNVKNVKTGDTSILKKYLYVLSASLLVICVFLLKLTKRLQE